jgi:hypothetical protein
MIVALVAGAARLRLLGFNLRKSVARVTIVAGTSLGTRPGRLKGGQFLFILGPKFVATPAPFPPSIGTLDT